MKFESEFDDLRHYSTPNKFGQVTVEVGSEKKPFLGYVFKAHFINKNELAASLRNPPPF